MQNGVRLFGTVGALAVGSSLLFFLFAKPIRKMCVGVNQLDASKRPESERSDQ